MSESSLIKTSFTQLIKERRYVYHIVTLQTFERIVHDGNLRSRNELSSISIDHANQALINLRSQFFLEPGCTINDAVPFYLTPRQPMFCRLIRERRVDAKDIVAIGFDFTQIQHLYTHWLFTTNPVYPHSTYLGNWDMRHMLQWDVLMRWHWNNDDDTKEEKLRLSAMRQAELLVKSPVSLRHADHLVMQHHRHYNSLLDTHSLPLYVIEGIFEW